MIVIVVVNTWVPIPRVTSMVKKRTDQRGDRGSWATTSG